MASRIRIAIDCMGGDLGLRVSLPAVTQSLKLFPDIDFVLVGDGDAIRAALPRVNSDRIDISHAPDVVAMSEKPSVALRRKRQSSMWVAIDLLHQAKVDAVVSAGNTGALMAIGCFLLGTMTGIARPAICSALPTVGGHCHLLDLGANVDSSAQQLYQFAIMAAALAAAIDSNPLPKIALLNIGEEAMKGNEQVKQAAKLIEADVDLNFIGFIEGDGLFSGDADIVVCDGFVGNVALKVCEGTAAHIRGVVKTQFGKNSLSRLAGAAAMPVLRRIYRILDPQQYNGASFLGLQGIVVKSHGNSSVESYIQAIAKARREVKFGIIEKIEKQLKFPVAND